jgi:chitinase
MVRLGWLAAAAVPCASGFVLSAYKDVTVNLNWNTFVLTTNVSGTTQSVASMLKATGVDTLSWGFASGECGAETWASVSPTDMAKNVAGFVQAGLKYIISTGGQAGSFSCSSDAAFSTFVDRYHSALMLGVDFDIESGQSLSVITALVSRAKAAESKYPNLFWSFTLPSFGGSANPILGSAGDFAVKEIKRIGLVNYYVNPMTMDYGDATAANCVLDSTGKACDMGASAVRAATAINQQYGVPLSRVMVTPMIGGNDVVDEVFTIADVTTLVNFARQNGLGGVHFWSLDRDKDCAPGSASNTCNTYGKAGKLGFSKAFAAAATGLPVPQPSPVTSPVASPVASPPAVPQPSPVSSPVKSPSSTAQDEDGSATGTGLCRAKTSQVTDQFCVSVAGCKAGSLYNDLCIPVSTGGGARTNIPSTLAVLMLLVALIVAA